MKYIELFKNGFDETITEKIKPANWPYVGYSPNEGFAFSIIPNEDGTMYTIYKVVRKDISNCTYNMVDLGLPSGLKWADRNVGAVSPEDFGSYFQWGDTNAYAFDGAGEVTAAELASLLQPLVGDEMEVTKDNIGDVLLMLFEGYDVGTNLTNTPMGALGFSLDKLFNIDSYFDTTDSGSTFNKYNKNGGLMVLESVDDAATAHMGSQYRMPTIDEMQELISGTTQTFISIVFDENGKNEYSQEEAQNGAIEEGKLKGVRFTSSNGNSIFIPAAGYCEVSLLYEIGMSGGLWSSSLYDSFDINAWFLNFDYDGRVDKYGNGRCWGRSIRGVQA